MPIYVPGKLVLAKDYVGIDDPDAAVYIAAVEAADEIESPGVGALETATKVAIHSFVKGCKADGIWPAIKASCVLAGARTLTGALVPLVGTAPTNGGGLFVSGDYNRKTGLVGDGSTKYLNSNRADNADPQSNHHLSVFATSLQNSSQVLAGSRVAAGSSQTSLIALQGSTTTARSRVANAIPGPSIAGLTGLIGVNRSLSASFIHRAAATNYTSVDASLAANSNNHFVFARALDAGPENYSNARLAFYSIGESLDLALLDARVTDLINAFAAAIP
jgi:hypothetical protein